MKLHALLETLTINLNPLFVLYERNETGLSNDLNDHVYKVIKRQFDAVLAMLRTKENNECALADYQPFLDLINTHHNLVTLTDADPNVNPQSPAYQLCLAIAEIFTQNNTPFKNQAPILIANPSLNRNLTKQQHDKVVTLPRHSWFVSPVDGYPIFVYDVLMARYHSTKYTLSTNNGASTRFLTTSDRQFFQNHSQFIIERQNYRPTKESYHNDVAHAHKVIQHNNPYLITFSYGVTGHNALIHRLEANPAFLFSNYQELSHWLQQTDATENRRTTLLMLLSKEQLAHLFNNSSHLIDCMTKFIPQNQWHSFLKLFNDETLFGLFVISDSIDNTMYHFNPLNGKPVFQLTQDEETSIRARFTCLAQLYAQKKSPSPPPNGKSTVAPGTTKKIMKALTQTFSPEEKTEAAQAFIDFLISGAPLGSLNTYLDEKKQSNLLPLLREKGYLWNSTLCRLVTKLGPWEKTKAEAIDTPIVSDGINKNGDEPVVVTASSYQAVSLSH